MKKSIIRAFLLSALFFLTTGLFECGNEAHLENEIEVVIYHPLVAVDSEVECHATQRGSAVVVNWSFKIKPENSMAEFELSSHPKSSTIAYSFVADVVGEYKFELAYRLEEGGVINYSEYFVEALNIKAIAGEDINSNAGEVVTLDGSASIGNGLSYSWTPSIIPAWANPNISNKYNPLASYLVDLPGQYLVVLKVTDINQVSDRDTVIITAVEPAQNPWSELGEYPGDGSSYLVAVGDGEFGYIGLGATSAGGNSQQFYKYTPPGSQGGNGTWEILNPFPTNETYLCNSFIIEDTIYVGLGREYASNTQSKQFHKYITTTGLWDEGIPVAIFPGNPGVPSLSFVLNNKAYVLDSGSPKLYKYDPVSNSWAALNDFNGGGRYEATSFVLNGTAYLGYGSQINFWRYDSGTDDWIVVSPLVPPGGPYRRSLGLATDTHGFILGGAETAKHLWSYNPSEGWKFKTSAIGDLVDARGFVINNIIYCGTGNGSKKWYSYDPSLDQANNKPMVSNSLKSKKK